MKATTHIILLFFPRRVRASFTKHLALSSTYLPDCYGITNKTVKTIEGSNFWAAQLKFRIFSLFVV